MTIPYNHTRGDSPRTPCDSCYRDQVKHYRLQAESRCACCGGSVQYVTRNGKRFVSCQNPTMCGWELELGEPALRQPSIVFATGDINHITLTRDTIVDAAGHAVEVRNGPVYMSTSGHLHIETPPTFRENDASSSAKARIERGPDGSIRPVVRAPSADPTNYDLGRADERVGVDPMLTYIRNMLASGPQTSETRDLVKMIDAYRAVTERVVAAGRKLGWYP